jgi:hypothetical protein
MPCSIRFRAGKHPQITNTAYETIPAWERPGFPQFLLNRF